MPRLLTSPEIDRFCNGKANFESIEDFRDFAASLRNQGDIEFLCRFVSGPDERTATRALTALFYFGAVVGIGEQIRKWLVESDVSSAIWTFAAGIAVGSVLQAADISAFRALRGAARDPSVAEDAYEYLMQIDEAFPPGTQVRAQLENGKLWHNGDYICQQLERRVETDVRDERLVWLLKAFPASTEAREAVRRYCGQHGIGVLAAHVLVGFMHETIPLEVLSRQEIANADEFAMMHENALALFRRTSDRDYYRLALSYEERDADGRLRQARLHWLASSD